MLDKFRGERTTRTQLYIGTLMNLLNSLPLFTTKFLDVFHALEQQHKIDSKVLNLTANENVLSNTASKFMGSIWGCRYHLGTLRDYDGKTLVDKGGLHFRGLGSIYELEKLARECLLERFNAQECEMRYLSGVHAVTANINLLTSPGDLILSIHPSEGGHFATKNCIEYCGRRHAFMKFNVHESSIDLHHLKKIIKENSPKLIFFDHGATLFPINVAEVKDLIPDDIFVIYDASHVLGLIMGKEFPNPLTEGASILQGNTHKSFPGPQKAIALWLDKKFNKIINGVDHAFVSTQHTHHSIALYVSALEMYSFGETYAKKMINNAQLFCETLEKEGVPLFKGSKGWTSTNVFLIQANSMKRIVEFCRNLNSIGISTNAREIFGNPCVRIGTQEVTRRGIDGEVIKEIAKMFARIWHNPTSVFLKKEKEKVEEITSSMGVINFSFDDLAY